MGAIFSVIAGMSSAIFGQFLLLFGRKYTVATATVLAYMATTLAMLACLRSIIQGVINLIVVPAWLSMLAWFIPSNAIGIISAILSARICHAAYLVATDKIKLISQSS